MNRNLYSEWFLILVFLGIIASLPISQAWLEIRRGQAPQALQVFRQKPTAKNLRAYENNLKETSWLAHWVRPWTQYAQFAWLGDGGEKALVGRDGWLFYKPGVQYLTERPAAQQATSHVGEAVAAIVAFRDQLAERGIELMVMPAPNKESVYPEQLTRRGAKLREATCPQTKTLFERLRAANIEVIDLFSLYVQAKTAAPPSTPKFYLAQDSHWSPAGVELAARHVAQQLRAKRPIPFNRVVYETKPSPVERLGDVLRMLQAPPLERRIAPEKMVCSQVIRQDNGQPYQDDPQSEILVLGDSFLRIYERDEPGAAGFVAHLARELGQPLTSIISDGGASTLVRQELHRRPALLKNKKIVLWEFVERDIRFGTEGWQNVPLPAIRVASEDESRDNSNDHLLEAQAPLFPRPVESRVSGRGEGRERGLPPKNQALRFAPPAKGHRAGYTPRQESWESGEWPPLPNPLLPREEREKAHRAMPLCLGIGGGL